MALDLAKLKAKLAEQKAAQSPVQTESQNSNTLPCVQTQTPVPETKPVESIPATNNPQEYIRIKNSISELNDALIQQVPNIAHLLRDIHAQLREDKSVVTILTEEEIGVITLGLRRHTSTEIATTAPKTAAKKALSRVTTDDL